jgi:hypothetical protein
MTLEEWAAIPWEQQRDLVIQWYKADPCLWFEYEDLALKAAAILRERLKAVPEVELVELGGGEIITIQEPWNHVVQLVLSVCTFLPETQHLAQVPHQLSGFPVQQVNLGDRRDAYLKTWKRLFKELKGWNETETLRWAERWTESLKSATSPLYSRGPVTTAVPSLIDKEIQQSVGDRLSDLHSELRDIIICRNPFEDQSVALSRALFLHPDTVEDYDWDYVRQRIKELLQKYQS